MTAAVLELRQYTLRPGARDTLVELFDREFVESQEELGMQILGQFRDLDRDDRFVWLRGYADLASRAPALQAFYAGPVWKAHSAAANATMLDVDDVLLLRPATGESGFALDGAERGGGGGERPVVAATICHLRPGSETRLGALFVERVAPELEQLYGVYSTLIAVNEFPALPIRDDAHVAVWFCGVDEQTSAARLCFELLPELAKSLTRRLEVLRLAPTARSLVPA